MTSEEIRLAALRLVEKTYSGWPGAPLPGVTIERLYKEALIPAAERVEAYIRGTR